MYRPCQPSHQVRFGEFQLDLQTAELQKNGHKLMLQDQPFQVLAILARNSCLLGRSRYWGDSVSELFGFGLEALDL
jgi:DNA-binding response OmpR family regulator